MFCAKKRKNDERRFDGLGGVESSVDVVVDGLGDGLAFLQGLDLFVHEVEVILFRVESRTTGDLTAAIFAGEM